MRAVGAVLVDMRPVPGQHVFEVAPVEDPYRYAGSASKTSTGRRYDS